MAHAFRNVKSGEQTIRVAVEGSGPLVLTVSSPGVGDGTAPGWTDGDVAARGGTSPSLRQA